MGSGLCHGKSGKINHMVASFLTHVHQNPFCGWAPPKFVGGA